MVMSGGQRLVGPGGQVIVAAPGQQLVRTSGGEATVFRCQILILCYQIIILSYQHLRSDTGAASSSADSDSGAQTR